MMTPASRVSSGRNHWVGARRHCKSACRQLGPKGRNTLRFAQVQAELLFGIKMLPTAAALKLADVGKPPLREGMPFLRNPVEADSALHNRH